MKDAAGEFPRLPTIFDRDFWSQLADELESLPKHDPDRFETLDDFDNPECMNGRRVSLAICAIEAFQGACHMNEDFEVAASDLICDLLHLVHSIGGSPKRTIKVGLFSFIAEAGRD